MSAVSSSWTPERRAAQAARTSRANVMRSRSVEHCHPVVRGFFQEKRTQLASFERIAVPAGIGTDSMKNWRRHMPRLDIIDAALNVLGFEIAIVPLGKRGPNGFITSLRKE